MANQEHLKILKQGVEAWNRWREENRHTLPDLNSANLRGKDLNGADLRGADLRRANLCSVRFNKARFGSTIRPGDLDDLDDGVPHLYRVQANLSDADLTGADFTGANLSDTQLSGVNGRNVILFNADLTGANFSGAILNGANLLGAILRSAELRDAQFHQVTLGFSVLASLDLSIVKGLDTVTHYLPSFIDIQTIRLSHGQIPEDFLRGCGLSDWEIETTKLYRPGLSNQEIVDVNYKVYSLRAQQAIQINNLFISYSHKDSTFVDHLEPYLNDQGIRFWRDVHHATSGRLEKQIDRAIRLNPTVLLILSANSVKSDWVEHEARKARDLEKELGRDVLCPVALDDAWKTCRWPERLREQIMEYNILPFTNWEIEAIFEQQFSKLIDGLDLFYKEK